MLKMRAFLSLLAIAGAFVAAPLALAHADQVGHASWYALHSRTASGEMMNPSAMTAAHRTLPFGTSVQVENLNNGRSVVVRINDRGPFVHGRVIDVSKAAAANLGMIGSGTAKVRISTSGGTATKTAAKSTATGSKTVTKTATKSATKSAATTTKTATKSAATAVKEASISAKKASKEQVRGRMASVAKSSRRTREALQNPAGKPARASVAEAADNKQYGIFAGGLFGGDKNAKAERRNLARN